MSKGIERYSPFCRSRLRSWLIAAAVILSIGGYSRQEFWNYALGAVMIVPGMLLHFSCKANLRQNRVLTRSGAYRWVRHPFYLANFVIDFGLCVLLGRWELTAIYGIFWVIAYSRQIGKEERHLIKLYGDGYRQYRKEVPAIIPWKIFPAADTGETEFSMKNPNIDTGNEAGRILRYASYPYLFFTADLIGRYGLSVFVRHSSWALIPPAAFFCLYWLGLVSRNYVSGRKSGLAAAMEHFPFRMVLSVLILSILIVTEGLIPEIDGPGHLAATSVAALLLLFPCAVILLETSGRAWFSYRFRILTELGFLMIMCALGGLFYLAAAPVFFYVPALMFGSSHGCERHRLSAGITDTDIFNKPAVDTRMIFQTALMLLGGGILFIQEILHLNILGLGGP